VSAQEWDTQRAQRTEALDAMLDALGAQVVPPDFHAPALAEDVFSPPDDAPDPFARDALASPAMVRDAHRRRRADRARWKTLRDFVDERGLEDALEHMDAERAALGDLLLATADYPAAIARAVAAVRARLPAPAGAAQPLVRAVLVAQEAASGTMAKHLEDLGQHFEEIEGALRESEAGEPFSEDDVAGGSRPMCAHARELTHTQS
jgi:autophagy-related protein 17